MALSNDQITQMDRFTYGKLWEQTEIQSTRVSNWVIKDGAYESEWLNGERELVSVFPIVDGILDSRDHKLRFW